VAEAAAAAAAAAVVAQAAALVARQLALGLARQAPPAVLVAGAPERE
jgi:hypothetical protein